MPKLEERTFSFSDVYSPEQAQTQRWIEIAEVADQLFTELVYPELARNKNLKSFFTADTQDLESINIDLYQDLFEQIITNEPNKRLVLSIKQEIIREKNSYDCLNLSLSSLGLSKDTLIIMPLFSPVDKPYSPENLVNETAFEDGQEYFRTSKVEISLNKNVLFYAGGDVDEARDSVETVLKGNIPEHIDIIIASHITTYGGSKSIGSVGISNKITIQNIT